MNKSCKEYECKVGGLLSFYFISNVLSSHKQHKIFKTHTLLLSGSSYFGSAKFINPFPITCPRFTSNSSSTQGVKSCKTTILLSGDNPCSFSIPTLTKVSILAEPVIRPIPGVTPLLDLLNSFSKSTLEATTEIIQKLNHRSSKGQWTYLHFFFFPRLIRTGHRNAIFVKCLHTFQSFKDALFHSGSIH